MLTFAFELVNGGRCSSASSQHDWGIALFSRRRMEQPTVVCHVNVDTVDFQATFKDVLVRDVVLMALTSAPLPAFLFTEHAVVFFVLCVTCP